MFVMVECNHFTTPMERKIKLTSTKGNKFEDATKYRHLVGCISYLTATRLDISFYVGILSRLTQNPCEGHSSTTKRVNYFKGSKILYT